MVSKKVGAFIMEKARVKHMWRTLVRMLKALYIDFGFLKAQNIDWKILQNVLE